MKKNFNTLTTAVCLGLSLCLPHPASALAPETRVKDTIEQMSEHNMRTQARELAQKMASQLRSLRKLAQLALEITEFETFIQNVMLLPKDTKIELKKFFEKYGADPDNPDGELLLKAINVLVDEVQAINNVYQEFQKHLNLIYGNEVYYLLDAIIHTRLETAEFDADLWELSNHHFETLTDVLEAWELKDLNNPMVTVHIYPELSHDIAVINDTKIAPNRFRVIVKSVDVLNGINERSEYIAAIYAYMLFPDLELSNYYDLPAPQEETPRFDSFIRLFYDYAERAENGIDMSMDYNQYREELRKKKIKPDYQDSLNSQQMNDSNGYFKLLDITPESKAMDIRTNYQKLRRRASLALISPRAPIWFEKQIREQQMKQADRAYQALGNPYNRINYDPDFRKAHPEILVEAAA